MKKALCNAVVCVCLLTATAHAQVPQGPAADLLMHYASTYAVPQIPQPMFAKNVVEKAKPDECYDPETGFAGVPDENGVCQTGVPKVNQAYVWGLTRSGNIWFGTAPNTLCMVLGGIMTYLPISMPIETAAFVCEFGDSHLVPPLPGELGDWRPPKMYEYNADTRELIDRTPFDPLVNRTLGIRSAGALNGVAMLAGPSLGGGIASGQGGINIFAFSEDGSFLGAQTLPEYSDIRQWVLYEGVLYAAVSNSQGQGRVLRWNGCAADPFKFEVVGRLDIEGANITVHEGRLFITTWPNFASGAIGNAGIAGLWMSPVIPCGGLTGSDNDSWQKVWSVTDYEPDPIVAGTYLGGALTSFDGHLIWGTMHLPFSGSLLALMLAEEGIINIKGADNESSPDDYVATMLGAHRSISVFSGRDFGGCKQNIEVLYGDEYLPVYDPQARSYTIAYDAMHRNKMPDPAPKWGPSGIGNFFNTYTWTMDRAFESMPAAKTLLLGTFDWSVVAMQMATGIFEHIGGDNSSVDLMAGAIGQIPCLGFGADLFVAKSAHEPFTLESNNGAGNYLNYGIRTMLMPEAGKTGSCKPAYLGMANPFNLATDPDEKQGGWELVSLYPRPEISLVAPGHNQILEGMVTLQARDISICSCFNKVYFHVFGIGALPPEQITEAIDAVMKGEPPVRITVKKYCAWRGADHMWEYNLDTANLTDGFYIVLPEGIDSYGTAAWGHGQLFGLSKSCMDRDGDGYGVGPGCAGPDCNENCAAVHDNCTCTDRDGDGYGEGSACGGPDCNDSNPVLHNDCSCTDSDGDGYGQGVGCAGPDCDDSNPALHDDCSCTDSDGDGYGQGAGCAGPDCDDTNAAVQDECTSCEVKLFPGKISRFFSMFTEMKAILIRGDSGMSFPQDAPVTWDTANIFTLRTIRISPRTLMSIVLIHGSGLQLDDVCKVRVGDCTGQLAVK